MAYNGYGEEIHLWKVDNWTDADAEEEEVEGEEFDADWEEEDDFEEM